MAAVATFGDTRILMGMPISIEVGEVRRGPAAGAERRLLEEGFRTFAEVEQRFSPFLPDSEVCRLNRGLIAMADISTDFAAVLAIAERTRRESGGYFDIRREDGSLDPSGIVKGWAIRLVARRLQAAGVVDFRVDAGGDIQTGGHAPDGGEWIVGIRNPFDETGLIKRVTPRGRGIATSGTYVRGQHIRNPFAPGALLDDLVSLTVIGADVLEADRFATAAFAMGRDGLAFLQSMPGLEGYGVTSDGRATMTGGFGDFCLEPAI